jgi:putative DNA primase/helicase
MTEHPHIIRSDRPLELPPKEAPVAKPNGCDPEQEAQAKATPLKQEGALLKSARASTFELSAIQWLWPDRFALGKLGLLVGLPDEGKGQIFADMAARVSCGREWPCDEGTAPQGNVIVLSAEDDPRDTVVPRLKAADADLECIEIVSMVRAGDKDRMFSLVSDLALLRQKITEVGNVKLILIDPISAYLGVGKVDSFRTTDVRAVLGPLVELASEFKVAVIGILHFNKKIDVTNALLRISDSMAFGATARHVYAVVDDAENKRKLMVRAKNNLAKSSQKALAYNFGQRDMEDAAGQAITAPYILWHAKHVDVSATEAMQQTKSPAARDDAKKFLADLLASGPMARKEIDDAAEGNGIAERTLFRAKKELNIIAKRDADDGGWTWRLPERTKRWNGAGDD